MTTTEPPGPNDDMNLRVAAPVGLVAGVLVLLLLVVGWGDQASLRGEHIWRLATAFGAAFLTAVVVLILWARRVRTRALIAAGGLAVAVAGWWWIPPQGGPSLWDARAAVTAAGDRAAAATFADLDGVSEARATADRLAPFYPHLAARLRDRVEDRQADLAAAAAADLEGTDPADPAGFAARAADRRRLTGLFPQQAPTIRAAETAWQSRALQPYVDRLRDLPAGDWVGYAAGHPARAAAAAAVGGPTPDLTAAEAGWAERSATQAADEARRTAAADPAGVERRLAEATARCLAAPGVAEPAGTPGRWPAARKTLVAARLDALRVAIKKHVAADQYAQAAAWAKAVGDAVAGEAEFTGRATEVRELVATAEYLAALARLAKQ